MACFVTGSAAGDAALAADEARREATKVTGLLCTFCEAAEAAGQSDLIPKDVQTWWTEHKQIDAERQANEAKRADLTSTAESAAAKLTPDEKAALLARPDALHNDNI